MNCYWIVGYILIGSLTAFVAGFLFDKAKNSEDFANEALLWASVFWPITLLIILGLLLFAVPIELGQKTVAFLKAKQTQKRHGEE